MIFIFFFFFSSRRRHTRWNCDWSSDVCSSDLARAAVLDVPLTCPPGDCYIYSDLGAIIVGMIVARVTGLGLDVYLRERVFAPLGMTHTFFRPADFVRREVAPTAIQRESALMVRGVVNDENAAALGGVAGHAGLFSTASDLAGFAQMLLNG